MKVFEMARDEEFGRMVVANRDLAVGDLVMEVRKWWNWSDTKNAGAPPQLGSDAWFASSLPDLRAIFTNKKLQVRWSWQIWWKVSLLNQKLPLMMIIWWKVPLLWVADVREQVCQGFCAQVGGGSRARWVGHKFSSFFVTEQSFYSNPQTFKCQGPGVQGVQGEGKEGGLLKMGFWGATSELGFQAFFDKFKWGQF